MSLNSSDPSASKPPFLDVLVLAVIGALIYANSLDVPFTFDDRLCILQNRALQHLNLFAIWSYTPTRFAAMASFALNLHFNGTQVLGFHLVNLAFHLGTGIGVWRLAHYLLPADDRSRHSWRRFAAFVAGALFLIHPLQTQAVTYVWQRTAVMAAFGFVWTLVYYLHLRRSLNGGDKSKARRYLLCGLTTLLLATFSKEIAFPLPLALLALELWGMGRAGRPPWRWLLPFGLGFLPIPAIVLTHSAQYVMPGIAEGYEPLSPIAYLLTQTRVLFTYARLIFVPLHQQVDYDYPIAHSVGEVWWALLGLALCAVGLVVCLRQWPKLGFALVLIGLGLSVECAAISLPDVIFEHRMYLPMVGVVLVVALLLERLDRLRALMGGICIAGLIALAILTWRRNELWRDSIALWTDNLTYAPLKARVWTSRSLAYREAKQTDMALADIERAVQLNPRYRLPYVCRGLLYGEQGRHQEAIDDFNRALAIEPVDSDVHNARGISLMSLGRAQEALKDFDYVLTRHPEWAQTHNYRGVALSALERDGEAIEAFNQALKRDPNYHEVHLNRAIVYERMQRLDEACDDYRRYLATDPEQRQAYLTLARLLDRRNQPTEAMHWLDVALTRFPDYGKAYFNRAVLHCAQGAWQAAIDDFSAANRLEPAGLTRYWRGNAYAKLGQLDAAAYDYLAAEAAGVNLPSEARTLAHPKQP